MTMNPPSSGKKRLLLLIHDLAPFGAQRVALNIVRYLDKAVFSAAVCSFGADETLASRFSGYGAEVTALGAGRYLDPAAWSGLVRLLRAYRPDIVQTNMAELSVPVRLMKPMLGGAKMIHAVQNPLSSEPPFWRSLNLLTLPLCDRIVLCSRGLADGSPWSGGLNGRRTRVVPNGIERAPVPAGPGLRAELGIAPEEKAVCCVGRLTVQKGQDTLIRAFAGLSSGRRLRLLLAGDGEDAAALKELAAGLGVKDRVHFLGRRPDAGGVLAAADVYAAPSRWEGLPLALGEAMLAGVPCAASAISGHADLLKDGSTGLSFGPDDVPALSAALARLLDGPEEAAKMAAAARAAVSAGFSAEAMARGYEEIYREISVP